MTTDSRIKNLAAQMLAAADALDALAEYFADCAAVDMIDGNQSP